MIYCGDPSHGDKPGNSWRFMRRRVLGEDRWYEEASDPSLVGRMRRPGQKATTQVLQDDQYLPSARREREIFAAPIRVTSSAATAPVSSDQSSSRSSPADNGDRDPWGMTPLRRSARLILDIALLTRKELTTWTA